MTDVDDKLVLDVAKKILDILEPLPPLEALRVLCAAAVACGNNDAAQQILNKIDRVDRAVKSIQRNTGEEE